MDDFTLSKKKESKAKQNILVFGYGLCAIFAFFSWHTAHKHGVSWVVGLLAGLSLSILVITLTNRMLLRTIYKRWMVGAHFIGTCISGLTLSLMFYLVFAPLGIFFRIIKKDFLSRSIEKGSKSYWIRHQKGKFDPKQCEKQF